MMNKIILISLLAILQMRPLLVLANSVSEFVECNGASVDSVIKKVNSNDQTLDKNDLLAVDCKTLENYFKKLALDDNKHYRSYTRAATLRDIHQKMEQMKKDKLLTSSASMLQSLIDKEIQINITKLKYIGELSFLEKRREHEQIFFLGIQKDGDKISIAEGTKRNNFIDIKYKQIPVIDNFPELEQSVVIANDDLSNFYSPQDLDLKNINNIYFYLKAFKTKIPLPDKPELMSLDDYTKAITMLKQELEAFSSPDPYKYIASNAGEAPPSQTKITENPIDLCVNAKITGTTIKVITPEKTGANLRDAPSASSEKLGWVKDETPVFPYLSGDSKIEAYDFACVQANGQKGWISKSLLSEIN